MCGGPTKQQKQAATSDTGLATTGSQQYTADTAAATPYFVNAMENGLPYFMQQAQYSTSNLGRATDIAKANLNAKLAGSGSALPSGFATSADANLEEGGAEAQEQNILQLLAQQTAQKNLGAASTAELGTTGASIAGGANQAVMNAPLANNFWSNLISGIVQGAAHAPIPVPAS